MAKGRKKAKKGSKKTGRRTAGKAVTKAKKALSACIVRARKTLTALKCAKR